MSPCWLRLSKSLIPKWPQERLSWEDRPLPGSEVLWEAWGMGHALAGHWASTFLINHDRKRLLQEAAQRPTSAP